MLTHVAAAHTHPLTSFPLVPHCRAVVIAKECQAATPAPAKLKDFKEYLEGPGASRPDIATLRKEVEAFAGSFPMPGL